MWGSAVLGAPRGRYARRFVGTKTTDQARTKTHTATPESGCQRFWGQRCRDVQNVAPVEAVWDRDDRGQLLRRHGPHLLIKPLGVAGLQRQQERREHLILQAGGAPSRFPAAKLALMAPPSALTCREGSAIPLGWGMWLPGRGKDFKKGLAYTPTRTYGRTFVMQTRLWLRTYVRTSGRADLLLTGRKCPRYVCTYVPTYARACALVVPRPLVGGCRLVGCPPAHGRTGRRYVPTYVRPSTLPRATSSWLPPVSVGACLVAGAAPNVRT